MSKNRFDNLVVYVVMGWPRYMTNDRVAKILKLRPNFRSMKLVARGSEPGDEDNLIIRSIPSPVGWLGRLGLHRLRYHLERLLFFPNPHVLFTTVARRRLRAIIRRDLQAGRDVCVVTCVPNHENTSIGLYLKRQLPDIYWVMEWQDLWSYDENYFERVLPAYRGLLKARERQVLETADVHVTTNTRAAQVLNEVYGVPMTRLCAIPHHFDRDELPAEWSHAPAQRPAVPRQPGAPLRIGFLGSLFKPPRVPGLELMKTLGKLRERGIDVELHLHGKLPPDMAHMKAALKRDGLVMQPRIPHRDCVPVLAGYDYLLVLLEDLPNSRAVMSIKLPQYLLTGRPVLAVVPEPSAVADVVSRCRAGVVIPTSGDWRQQLSDFLAAPERRADVAEGVPSLDLNEVEELSWERLSGRWLAVLGAAARRPAASVSVPSAGVPGAAGGGGL